MRASALGVFRFDSSCVAGGLWISGSTAGLRSWRSLRFARWWDFRPGQPAEYLPLLTLFPFVTSVTGFVALYRVTALLSI